MGAHTRIPSGQRQNLLDALRVISSLFWGVDIEKGHRLFTGDDLHVLERLLPLLSPDTRDAYTRLEDLVRTFASGQDLCEHLAEGYIPLFVNARGGIAAPLYQSCYPERGAPQAPAGLMEAAAKRMQARFTSRGLNLDSGLNEPPDHLAVELEYLYFLLDRGWAQSDPSLLNEAVDFTRTELLPWVPAVEERVAKTAAGSFYALLLTILLALLRLIGERDLL